jgi:hypothetical protein
MVWSDRPLSHPTKQRAYRDEADRLKLLGPETQRDLAAMFRIVARNAKLPESERERARALAKLLAAKQKS